MATVLYSTPRTWPGSFRRTIRDAKGQEFQYEFPAGIAVEVDEKHVPLLQAADAMAAIAPCKPNGSHLAADEPAVAGAETAGDPEQLARLEQLVNEERQKREAAEAKLAKASQDLQELQKANVELGNQNDELAEANKQLADELEAAQANKSGSKGGSKNK